jgi:hypothetical protein
MPAQPIPHPTSSVVVLWGELFDEIAATTMCGILRRRGLRAYLVGVDGPAAPGHYGIMLYADRTLGQISFQTGEMLCVVIPCMTAAFHRAETDPRLGKFLEKLTRRRGYLIVYDDDVLPQSTLVRLEPIPGRLLYYGRYADLARFADGLANMLLAEMSGATTN